MAHDDWASLLEDLAVRHAAASAMGGPDRLAQLAERGRLDVRTRIEMLVDADSFVEYGALVGSVPRGARPPAPADAFVCGHATIDGTPVVVGASDPTVMGGSVGPGTVAKRRRIIDLAGRRGVPLVLLLDGPGMRTRLPNDSAPWRGDEVRDLAALASRVLTVAAVLGPVAGHDALLAATARHVVMAPRGAVFGAGPPEVRAVTGLEVSARELGGPDVVHPGLVEHVATDEAGAIDRVRELVGRTSPRSVPGPDRPARVAVRAVLPADPGAAYEIDAVLGALADRGTWVRDEARTGNVVTGWMAVDGIRLGVVAGAAHLDAGRLDVAGLEAARRRVTEVGAEGAALLVVIDSSGLALGPAAERAGTLRAAAALTAATAASDAPVIAVVLRRAYGDVPTIFGLGSGAHVVVALATPAARSGPLPAETGVEAMVRPIDVAALLEHTEFGGAVDAADQLLVDRVVDPDDLRSEIRAALRLC